MKKYLLVILSLLILTIEQSKAQDTIPFKPSGKPEALIFTDFSHSVTNGENASRFQVTRAYFGYGYNFNPSLFGRVTLDVANPGVGGLQLTALLKYAYLQYQKQDLTVKFGLIGTNSFDVQEKFWGYRYILKSFQDQYGMNSSADFGLSAAYRFNDFVSADLIVQNGEGYKVLDADSVLKTGAGLTIRPLKGVILRGYYDIMKKGDATQQTAAVMAGYANKVFSIGGEYNHLFDYRLVSGRDFSGYSIYGTIYSGARTNLFARYDCLSSSTPDSETLPWNFTRDGKFIIAGFEYVPVKGIRVSPNYQLSVPRDVSKSNTSSIFLNVEIKM